LKLGQSKRQILKAARTILGQDRTLKLLLARNFRHYRRAGLIFIHVPKCAGTSVSKALYGSSLGHYTARELRSFSPNTFNDLTTVAVIRDPFERALSAYKYANSGGTKTGWAASRQEYDQDSFATFESFANTWLAAQSTENLDYVFRRQTDFILDREGNIIVDQLVKLEDLVRLWPTIIKNKKVSLQQIPELNRQNAKSLEEISISDDASAALRLFYKSDFDLWDSLK